ncbi:calcium-binding protein [Zavarzinia marina]|uniref:calcium-binding protein n=1 Tax=Zavarzinia marina TaxID=2911065 RepID=UPI0022A8C42F|nr:calcium-binding protein [Zavarzinia marina]
MPIFDYKGQDGRALLSTAWSLAAYTGIQSFGAEPLLPLANPLLNLGLGTNAQPPSGWREVSAAELGLDQSRVDAQGFFKGDRLLLDDLFTSQAKIWVREDAGGQPAQVAIVFAPTNNPLDVIDYPSMISGDYVHALDYLIEAVKTYAEDGDLSGEDVIVTGYSLGAGATNNMFGARETDWGGFFADSDYVAGAVPVIVDEPGIANIGFENDVVHRVAGDATAFQDAIGDVLLPQDPKFDTSVDNLILFDDAYASPLWPYGVFSVANLTGWVAHIEGVFTNPVERIGQSTFYDHIEQDSVILLSFLTNLTRASTWVHDRDTPTSDHFGDPAFLLGTEFADRLQDGASDDFLDGFGANDRFRLSTGTDTVAGGLGTDTVYVEGAADRFEAYRLDDGTLYLFDTGNLYGLKELTGVERVTFSDRPNLLFSVEDAGLVSSNTLLIFKSENLIGYEDVLAGTGGKDALTGTDAPDHIFAAGGNDSLRGEAGDDLLHGGAGNDLVMGGADSDILYGGAGDDRLYGGAGNDGLTGGVGGDLFYFNSNRFGHDRVTDFNIHENGHDQLVFKASTFATADAVLAAATQVDDDVVIDAGAAGSVILAGITLADLSPDDFVLV